MYSSNLPHDGTAYMPDFGEVNYNSLIFNNNTTNTSICLKIRAKER